MDSQFKRPAYRVARIAAVLLVGAIAACNEQPTSFDPEVADPPRAVTPLATSITRTLLTAGKDTVNKKVYTTASISPAPNALITLAVLAHRGAAPPSPTVTGGGMAAWAQVATVTFATVGVPQKRMTIYRALSASPGSGPLTITFAGSNVTSAQWIVSQWGDVDLTGANGAGAIVQTGSARADAGNGLTVTLAPFAHANNVAYGVFGVKKKVLAVTPGAGFTEISEQPSGESPLSDLQAEWATNDNTINASWTNLSAGALGVEIRAGGTGGGGGVSPSLSTVTADPTSITGGSGTSTITVTAKDASGAPISGATVVLSATGTGNTLTTAGPTNGSGIATGTLSSTVAESKTVSATANGTAITQTATVEVLATTPATITHTLLASGNDTVNQRIYTTASISPTPNALITLAVQGHRGPTASPSPVVTGGGMTTWAEVATVVFDSLGIPFKRMTIYRALSASPGSGPLTITFAAGQSNAQWIVSEWDGVDLTGANGAGAIVQTGSASADKVLGLTVPLAPFAHPNNVAYGAFGVKKNVAAVTPGPGFTEIAEEPSGEITTSDLQAEWATNDNTIDASWARAHAAALGVEIKAANTD